MSYFYSPRPNKLWLKFDPAQYGATIPMVERCNHYGNTIQMADGTVIVEYNEPLDLVYLFFTLQITVQVPTDIEPPKTPAELRNIRANQICETIVVFGGPILAVAMVIYIIFSIIFEK